VSYVVPEVQVLVQRAMMRRSTLEDLVAAIPPSYWARQAPGDDWTAAAHLRHLATVDDFIVEILDAVRSGQPEVGLGSSAIEDRRLEAIRSLEGSPLEEVVQRLRTSRPTALALVARLGPVELEAVVIAERTVDAWGAPLRWPLRTYLAAWAEHDDVHAHAIREAVSTHPDLSAVMLTHRRQP
jgi:hypothetical protein